MTDVLAVTCPICGPSVPGPCAPGKVHTQRVKAALTLENAVAMLHAEQNRVATVHSRRIRIDAMLAEDPFGLQDAVLNWQVLNDPPSRRKTAPYPIVGTGREFRG